MAKVKKPRTVTMTDETFDALRAIAFYRSYRTGNTVSVSSLIETLAERFVAAHRQEAVILLDAIKRIEKEGGDDSDDISLSPISPSTDADSADGDDAGDGDVPADGDGDGVKKNPLP